LIAVSSAAIEAPFARLADNANLKDVPMTKLKLTMLAAAATLAGSIGGASAMPLNGSLAVQNDNLVQNARIICDNRGRCYEIRRNKRVYVPAPRSHRAYRHHHDRYDHNRGVGIGVGGVDIRVR
jgi:hypothetical protein